MKTDLQRLLDDDAEPEESEYVRHRWKFDGYTCNVRFPRQHKDQPDKIIHDRRKKKPISHEEENS